MKQHLSREHTDIRFGRIARLRHKFTLKKLLAGAGVALVALTGLTGLSVAADAPAAQAAEAANIVEHALPAADFNVQCLGETLTDPANAGPDTFRDLTAVTGERLAAYNAGELVVLYESSGYADDAYPPLCAVRFVEGVGAVAEWMFCTDMFAAVCGDIRDNGLLHDESFDGDTSVSNPQPVDDNDKLSPEQETVIAWLLQNTHEYTGHGYYAWEINGSSPEGIAAVHGTTHQRWAMQTLVWCVSDLTDSVRASQNASLQAFEATCDELLPLSKQQEIIDAAPVVANAEVSLTPAEQEVLVGAPAEVLLTSNVIGSPITVTATGDSVLALCDAATDATLEAGLLTLGPASDGEALLCLTSTATADTTLTANITLADRHYLSWNQSIPVNQANNDCQVYSTWESHQASAATQATVSVRFAEQPEEREGTFSMQKQLSGIEAGDFPAGTTFEVTASWEGGSQTYALPADGTIVDAELMLPAGTVVTFTEGTLPETPEGYTFESVSFSATSIEILADDNENIAWVITNTYDEEELVTTGGISMTPVALGATALAALGLALVVLAAQRRRQQVA